MSNAVADCVLFFSNEPGYLLMSLLAFFFLERKYLVWALALLLFTTVYNVGLKYICQVPLPPALNKEGFAFPSGHMHSSVVFYGTLAYGVPRKRLWVGIALVSFLSLIGIALVSRGYHYPPDVFAAAGFGLVSVTITCWLGQQKPFAGRSWALPLAYFFLALALYLFFLPLAAQSFGFVQHALAGLLIFMSICLLGNYVQKRFGTIEG
jgi:undecaprenyl-diphosphatase